MKFRHHACCAIVLCCVMQTAYADDTPVVDGNAEVTDLDNGKAWTREGTLATDNRAVESTTTGSLVENDDGSLSYRRDRTVVNEDGEYVTQSRTADVARDDDGGLTVDRQRDVAGSGGRSASAGQTGSLARDEDGSGSFARTANASVTNADGETRTAQADRQAAWRKNDEGGRDFESARNVSTSEGRAIAADTSARATRDGSGSGSFESVHNRTTGQGSARTERSAARQVNADGSVTRERSRRHTRN